MVWGSWDLVVRRDGDAGREQWCGALVVGRVAAWSGAESACTVGQCGCFGVRLAGVVAWCIRVCMAADLYDL